MSLKKRNERGPVESIPSAGSTHPSTLQPISWSFIQVTTDGGKGAKKWNVKMNSWRSTRSFYLKKKKRILSRFFCFLFVSMATVWVTWPRRCHWVTAADSACCLQQQRQLVAHSNGPAGDSHLLLQLPWQPATTGPSSQWGGTDILISFYGGGGGAHCHVFIEMITW